MAGGPATPQLAAAVSEAGGLGFLAAGYRSASDLEGEIQLTRELTSGPFGVNLFVPQPSLATPESIAAYRDRILPDAARYGVEPGQTHPDDDAWNDKLTVVERLAPAVVSFTFGSPGREAAARLQRAGIAVGVTVTSLDELRIALADAVDLLIVQGPEAGGHRGTFDPGGQPDAQPLHALLAALTSNTRLPIVAAGGLMSRTDVGQALAAGAVAAQLGTAFLRAAEAGTRALHAEALASGAFIETAVTRAFSGRYARGLVNEFMREHSEAAPPAYPELHQLTAPIRAAAARAGDAERLSLWAGTGFQHTVARPAADIVDRVRRHPAR
jgi:nitronate monooxygenase